MHTSFLYMMTIGLAAVSLTACHPTNSSTPDMYQPVPTVIEPGLAYGQPCSPPCWQGLTPGKSTSADVAKAIEELQASGWTVSDRGNPDTGFSAYPLDTISGSIHVHVESGVVSYTFGALAFDYSVGELVRRVGEPESLYSIYRVKQSPKTSCAEQNFEQAASSAPMVILYPSRGMIFTTSAPITALGLICSEMKVKGFCYYTPLLIQEALKDDYVAKLCGFDGLNGVTEKDLIKWPGLDVPY